MPVDTEAPQDDLRATIESAFTSDAPEPAEAPVTDAAPAEAEAPEPAKLEDHPTDPNRYANGKFKPTKAEAAPEQVEQPAEKPSTDTAKVTEQPASTPVVAPPAGWTAAEKAEWSKLSPAVQAAVSRREQEISRGGQQWSEEKRRYESVLAPVAQEASRMGIGVDQALKALMAAHHHLMSDAPGAIRKLAAQFNVDLATIAGQSAEGSAPSQPDISALVRQAVQPLLAPIQQRFMDEEMRQQQTGLTLVQQFAAQPGHEHYEALESTIVTLLPHVKEDMPGATPTEWLQEAYDRAAYANPNTRASLLASQTAAAEAQRIADAKAKAAKARMAGSSVNGAPNGAAIPGPKDSLRAEIEAAFSGS